MKNKLLQIILLVSLSPCLLVSLSPCLLVSLSPCLLVSQDLQFYREDIFFTLRENHIKTDAVYHFVNVGEKEIKTPLFYPFPENTMELIDSIEVKNEKSGEVIPHRPGKSGIFFNIEVKAYGQASYRVFYRQKLVEKQFTYILTSTEAWNRPLEFANFELCIPMEIHFDSLSYPPDTSYLQKDFQHYLWKKKEFMPEKDFEVWFQ